MKSGRIVTGGTFCLFFAFALKDRSLFILKSIKRGGLYYIFAREEKDWLRDYALFMALKRMHDMRSWYEWEDEGIRLHKEESCAHYLELGAKARINRPGTLGGNWTWRMEKGVFTKELRKRVRRLTELYERT